MEDTTIFNRVKEWFQRAGGDAKEAMTTLFLPGHRVNQELPQSHDWRNFADQGYRQNTIIFACFEGDTGIVSEDSALIPISKIHVGDLVRTHTGKMQKVVRVGMRLHRGKFYTIRRTYWNQTMRVTGEHPLLAVRYDGHVSSQPNKQEPEWIRVRDLRKHDFLLEPIPSDIHDILYTDICQKSGGGGKAFTQKILVDFDLLRLIGYFLAEGWISKTVGSVSFAFHSDEVEFHADVTKLMFAIFKVKCKKYPGLQRTTPGPAINGFTNNGKTTVLTFNSTAARNFFTQFGHRATGKFIPQWVLDLPPEKQAGLLLGHWRGDGCRNKQINLPHDRMGKNSFMLDTSSSALAEGLRTLLLRQKVVPSLNIGLSKNRNPLYRLQIDGGYAHKLAQIFGEEPPMCSRRSRARLIGQYVYYAITNISTNDEDISVYNLEVETDHSYVAAGVAAHNCINEIATSIAEPDLVVRQQVKNDVIILSSEHPLVALLERPNDDQSQFEFLETALIHLNVTGNIYILKSRSAAGRVVALRLLRPDRIRIVPGADGRVARYTHTVDGQKIPEAGFLAEDVIHIKRPDPLDDYYGFSPISVLARFCNLDSSATDMLRAFFLSGMPSGIIKVKGSWEKEKRQRLKTMWKEEHSGLQGWSSVSVLDSEAEYESLGATPEKLAVKDIFLETEVRICQAFQVPPILVGTSIGLLRSTMANYHEARKSFWLETLKPMYTRITDALTHGLIEEFGSAAQGAWIEFDLSRVSELQEDLDKKRERALKAWDGGVIMQNEVRGVLGFPPLAGGDVVKQNLQDVFVGAVESTQGMPMLLTVDRGARVIRPITVQDAMQLMQLAQVTQSAQPLLLPETSAQFVDKPARVSEWKLMHKLADAEFPALEKDVVKVLREFKSEMRDDLLKQGLAKKDVEAALRAVDFGKLDKELGELFQGLGIKLMTAAGEASGKIVARAAGGTSSFVFDAAHPKVVDFAQRHAAELVTQVSGETKKAVRQIIVEGLEKGLTPLDHGRHIRDIVGLTSQHASAVDKLRDRLVADGLSEEEIQRQVDKKAEQLLRWRGNNIARTETMTAVHNGQRAAWMQARDDGVVPSTSKRVWVVTPDDKLCPYCEPMEDMNPNGVGMDEQFQSDLGAVDGPPLHNQCRCSEALEIGDREFAEPAKAEGFDDSVCDLASRSGYEQCSSRERCLDRAARATASHVPATREIQAIADRQEQRLAKATGGIRTQNNAPLDVLIGKKHGIEVKTLVVQKNDKITMHPKSLARKVLFVEENKLQVHTVVFDQRPGSHGAIYYAPRLGSLRIGAMEKVTLSELKRRLQ